MDLTPVRAPRLGVLTFVVAWLVGLALVVSVVEPLLLGWFQTPAHVAGARRLPPHVVKATTRPGVWSELSVTDGQKGHYEGQWIHAVTGRLHVEGRHLCARPKLYLNGALYIRGFYRCGWEELRFIAWTSTREMPWYGPAGATFELVWTDPWSRAHPTWKFQ